MNSLYYKIAFGKKSYVPHAPKFSGAGQGKRSWENIYLDINLELSETISDWLKDDFKCYFRKWNASIYDVTIVQTDEYDVTFGYISMKNVVLPFISKYLLTNDEGSRYRIFFFNEIKPSKFAPDLYDYEAEIEKLVEKNVWNVS